MQRDTLFYGIVAAALLAVTACQPATQPDIPSRIEAARDVNRAVGLTEAQVISQAGDCTIYRITDGRRRVYVARASYDRPCGIAVVDALDAVE